MTPIERKARELLPCPFCGTGDPYVMGPTCKRSDPYNPADRLFPTVRCRGCFVEATGKDGDFSCSSAITAWNRRAPDQATEALRAEVERLQRQLRQAHKDYGCELRDPNGTIWEYAAAQKARADRLAEALRELVDALDATSWSSWQTTASFDPALVAARDALHPQEADRG